jgi:hypothetical protein
MTPPANPECYDNHRYPGEIISHGVWLYYRFSLSYRDVQELLFERGMKSPTSPSASGAVSSGRIMPIGSVAVGLGPGINGTWMRCF